MCIVVLFGADCRSGGSRIAVSALSMLIDSSAKLLLLDIFLEWVLSLSFDYVPARGRFLPYRLARTVILGLFPHILFGQVLETRKKLQRCAEVVWHHVCYVLGYVVILSSRASHSQATPLL